MSDDALKERMAVVKALLRAFRLERLVYLAVTVLSVALLFACAILILKNRGAAGAGEIVALVGSGGGITISTSRLLKMWGDAVRILGVAPEESGK